MVVSYRRDNMILFEGGIYEFGNFKPVLEQSRFNAAPLLRAPYGTVFEKVVTVLKKIV